MGERDMRRAKAASQAPSLSQVPILPPSLLPEGKRGLRRVQHPLKFPMRLHRKQTRQEDDVEGAGSGVAVGWGWSLLHLPISLFRASKLPRPSHFLLQQS